MKQIQILGYLLLGVLIIWGIQVLYLWEKNASQPLEIKSQEEQKGKQMTIEYKYRERKLIDEYERRKYLATGKTVYDRIFNKPGQPIIDLIQNITKEALPSGWVSEAKVDEFTHFILLVYLPHNAERIEASKVTNYFIPILNYCSPYLSNIAIFDRTHTAYLFFDKDTLLYLKDRKELTNTLINKLETQGNTFTRFNSTTVQCEKYESHLFLPVEISGPNGVVKCNLLFDSGASTTTLSEEVVNRTGFENLTQAPSRSFNTANGVMSCPIVHREVIIEGFRRNIEVAVNRKDKINLLGMNFFEGMKYVVDFQNSCIYLWEK